jgi:hypothetical protein
MKFILDILFIQCYMQLEGLPTVASCSMFFTRTGGFPVWMWDRTSTIALQVTRGDGKGTQSPGVYLGHPVTGGYKYGGLDLQVGGCSRIGTVKYGLDLRW